MWSRITEAPYSGKMGNILHFKAKLFLYRIKLRWFLNPCYRVFIQYISFSRSLSLSLSPPPPIDACVKRLTGRFPSSIFSLKTKITVKTFVQGGKSSFPTSKTEGSCGRPHLFFFFFQYKRRLDGCKPPKSSSNPVNRQTDVQQHPAGSMLHERTVFLHILKF